MSTQSCSRRSFLAKATVCSAGALLAFGIPAWAAARKNRKGPNLATPNAEKLGWRIACQTYTFRDRSFYETLEALSNLGVRRVEPAFFLPLSKENKDLKTGESLTADQRREMKRRMMDAGISMPNYYGPLDKDQSTYRKVFDFAKEMGVETIVAEPPIEMLEPIDKLCQEYKINVAIHNHPEGSGSLYWNPETLPKVCAGRSERIGGCPDTGHWVRSGLNTLDSLKKYYPRIVTMHAKDAEKSGVRDSRDVPLGTGQGNYTALLKQLHDWNWTGVITVEYEHQSPQLVEEVAQCVAFIENFAGSVKG